MQDFKNFDPRQSAMDAARAMLEQAAKDAMNDGTLPQKELPSFVVEVPGDVKNGDLAANLAMASARVFGMPPRKIAGKEAFVPRRHHRYPHAKNQHCSSRAADSTKYRKYCPHLRRNRRGASHHRTDGICH